MKTDNKNSFILYTEYEKIMEMLSNEEAGALFKGILNYCSNGKEPNLKDQAKVAFGFIKLDLDRNAEKYKQRCDNSRINGQKGGRPKQEQEEIETSNSSENKTQNNPKNPTVFFKTQKNPTFFLKTLNDNDNENENENENENSLSRDSITEKEREILRSYVKKNKLASKNINAYIRGIIKNGDHIRILSEEREKLKPPKDYSQIISAITDKKSAFSALSKFCFGLNFSPPAEFGEIMSKYDLETYEKMEEYSNALCKEHYGY